MSAHQSLSSNSRQRTFITADFTSSVDLTAASLKLLEEKCSPRNSSLEINRLQVTSKSATDFASAKRKVSHVTLDPGSSSEVQLQGWAGNSHVADGSKSRRKSSAHSLGSGTLTSKTKFEEFLNLDHMQELKRMFEDADADQNGCLDIDEFKGVFKKLFGMGAKGSSEELITALFMKVDTSSDGFIDWGEFCSYMLTEFSEKDDAYHRSVEVLFNLPAIVVFTPHRDTIVRICHQSDNILVTASQDGMLAFWTTDLSLKRTFYPPKLGSRGADAVGHGTEATTRGADTVTRPKKRWVTDVALLTQFNKFVISTGERELQFYELSSFEPYCHISGLESVPLKLHFWSDPKNHNYCLLSFGDGEGCISTFIFYNISSCFRLWKKFPRSDQVPSVTLDQVASSPDSRLVRWKVHEDWVAELRYFEAIRSVVSCSHDPNSAVVIGSVEGSTHVESFLRELSNNPAGRRNLFQQKRRHYDADQTVFKIYKGAKTFDFSAPHNTLATGGMDRVLRLWNPYMPSKPVAMLRGHNGPITKLAICEAEARVYTISTDKTVKVWHIQDQTCLTTVTEKSHKVTGTLQAMHYNPGCRTLAVATDVFAVLSLKGRLVTTEKVLTHQDPVRCVKYNSSFKLVLTCCDGSVVRLWDLETGVLVFEFSHAHDDQPIVDMAFDLSQRRLFTAGQDGTIRCWNFNNGATLNVFKKDNRQEFTSLAYVNHNQNRFIVGVGWDRRLNIFHDVGGHMVQYPQNYWPEDLQRGHQEDILDVIYCPPHFIATACFDGEIIIWNLVSGSVFSRLLPPKPSQVTSYDPLEGDAAVSCLVFLETRLRTRSSASLISNGPKGCVHFWQIYHSKLMGSFSASQREGGVSTMATTASNAFLFTADYGGFCSVWDIRNYCLLKPSSTPPRMATTWQAHADCITSIEFVEQQELLLTSCVDCCVRLWTVDGHFIGTFGQTQQWNTHDSSTFEHPMVPSDVLRDPIEMQGQQIDTSPPDIVTVDIEDNVYDNEQNGEDMEADEQEEIISYVQSSTMFPPLTSQRSHLSHRPYSVHSTDSAGHGKRLRHEVHKPKPQNRGGLPNYYRSLPYYNVESVELPEQPNAPATATRQGKFDEQ